MEIPVLDNTDRTQDKIESLSECGCLVVKNVTSEHTREKVRTELEPAMDSSPAEIDDPEAFYPGNTRRMSALIALSETTGKLATYKMSMDICDHFLLPNSNCGYQLHVSAAVEVGPGSRKQILHREADPFPFFDLPRPNLIVASMWAITDFRADNGATLLVPGSHTWGKDRKPKNEEILSAEMPAGSVLYWLGGTLHGAGANVSNDWRYGVILSYSLGWLRQEENQYLDVLSEDVKKLPKDLAELIGYRAYGGLGFSINPEHFFLQDD